MKMELNIFLNLILIFGSLSICKFSIKRISLQVLFILFSQIFFIVSLSAQNSKEMDEIKLKLKNFPVELKLTYNSPLTCALLAVRDTAILVFCEAEEKQNNEDTVNPVNYKILPILIRDIQLIKTHRESNVFQYSGYGSGIGFALGVFIGLASGDDPPPKDNLFPVRPVSSVSKAVGYGVLFAGIGFGVSVLAGIASSSVGTTLTAKSKSDMFILKNMAMYQIEPEYLARIK